MRRLSPRAAAYLVAAVLSASFAYDLLRMPVQVSDSLLEIVDAQRAPSVYATFLENAQGAAYLRPLRLAIIKALFDVSHGHYWLAYRGFHALLMFAAILLFVRALRVRTWTDCAAAVFALTVLTGLHTFRGTVREAYPVNHFLEMVVVCLLALNLAQSRGGWWIDAAAVVTLVAASLILESGLLVWVVAGAALFAGLKGISRRGFIAMSVVVGLYFWARFFYLSMGTPGLTERSSGFLLSVLDPPELQQRFGANPVWFYQYNIAASVLSVLFSEPQGGVFELVRAWLSGDVPPRLYVAVVSSVLATGLVLWVCAQRLRRREQRAFTHDDQLLIVFAAVLISNAVMSYAYTKDEIVSIAGAFYACAAFAAARYAAEHVALARSLTRRRLACAVLAATAAIWAFRSAGVHHMMRVQAFKERNDWAALAPRYLAEHTPDDRRAAALARQLRADAFAMRIPNPGLQPRWLDRWWGE